LWEHYSASFANGQQVRLRGLLGETRIWRMEELEREDFHEQHRIKQSVD